MHDLVLDLHPDQEEEDRHERIVDPGVNWQLQPPQSQLQIPDVVIRLMPRRVGPHQRCNRRQQQHDAADALNVNELLDGYDERAGHQRLANSGLKATCSARGDSWVLAHAGLSLSAE